MGKMIGSIFLLMGTLIGGGMLAIPLVSSGVSFLYTALLLICMWMLMLFTGLLFLEVNLAYPFPQTNFSSMASHTLGKMGKILTATSYLILLYSLVAAYVSAGGSLLNQGLQLMQIHIPTQIASLLFVLLLGGFVIHGIRAVDYLNRLFFSLKALFLLLVLFLSFPKIHISYLSSAQHSGKFLWAAAPIFLCAFGYHILIPVLSQYLNYKKNRIRFVLFLGSFFTLILYLLWLAVTMGAIPRESFLALAEQKGSVGEFVSLFSNLLKSRWIESALLGFANITVTTCFLGVCLGLFDFLADFLKKQKLPKEKMQIALLTFIPPLGFAILFPKGFVFALGNAAIGVAISHVILPAWMVFHLRKKKIASCYQVFGGNLLLGIVFLLGVALILLQLLQDLKALPSFGK
jgi:tyrosine-specific transport protein